MSANNSGTSSVMVVVVSISIVALFLGTRAFTSPRPTPTTVIAVHRSVVSSFNDTALSNRLDEISLVVQRLQAAPTRPPYHVPAELFVEDTITPMNPRDDKERRWRHQLLPLPPAYGAGDLDVFHLTTAFEKYRLNPRSLFNVPVYVLVCINASCALAPEHWRNMAGGVGHVIVVASGYEANVSKLQALEERFPNRFTLLHYPNGSGNAESMNSGLRLGFAIRPMPAFVQVANGDLWVNRAYSNAYSRFNHLRADTVCVTQVRGFSHFSVTRLGWDRIGIFDEAAYVREATEAEYQSRLSRVQCERADYPVGRPNAYGDFTSVKLRDEVYTWIDNVNTADDIQHAAQLNRSATFEYMYRKFGPNNTFSTPFNATQFSWRHSSFPDPQHRHCVSTGEGPRYEVTAGEGSKCPAVGGGTEPCAGCLWSADAAFAASGLPSGTEIAAVVRSKERQSYVPAA